MSYEQSKFLLHSACKYWTLLNWYLSKTKTYKHIPNTHTHKKKSATCRRCFEPASVHIATDALVHSAAGTRLSTIDLFHNPIEHGWNQTMGTQKKPQNNMIEHENRCDVAVLYRRILLLKNKIHLNVNKKFYWILSTYQAMFAPSVNLVYYITIKIYSAKYWI